MRIYLDNNATTALSAEVLRAMTQAFRDCSGNPDSPHKSGKKARNLLDQASDIILSCVGTSAQNARVFFTSGATEANNWAIRGLGLPSERSQVVISGGEHSSILVSAEHFYLKTLDILALGADGQVIPELLDGYINERVRLVSVQAANHETGAIEPIEKIAAKAHAVGALFHTDAAQAAGKMPLYFDNWNLDAMSLTAHKIHGPVGIGALIVRRNCSLEPILFGGGQQDSFRPGTQPAALAIGLATALERAVRNQKADQKRLEQLRDKFEMAIASAIPAVTIHAKAGNRLGHVSNIAFPGKPSQKLRDLLDARGVECSVGSACSANSPEPSPTLLAMGVGKPEAQTSLRFSLGTTTTELEVIQAARIIIQTYNN